MEQPYSFELDDVLTKLVNEKKSAREFQLRKHEDWNENYELARGKVKLNRLTQRQSVNIPLMKETIKTLLAGTDDAPSVDWKEKAGDQVKELIYQEIWDTTYKNNSIELLDILDKKNVLLYGLSTKMLNVSKEGVDIAVLDPYDIVFDPLMHPLDIESARFIVRQNIFRTLREILADDRYTEKGKDKLKAWVLTDKGVVQSGKNKEEWQKRQERLRSMGMQDEKFSVFAGGDVIVSLTEHFSTFWNEKTQAFERKVITYADDTIELLNEPLKNLMGVDFWPFDVWCEDPETNDIYPDAIADIIRTPNKILNVWFSQQIENRTLQNFQMHWFDSTIQGYQPQTYEPGPGRMLPAPGDPSKTIMPVAINGLDETFNAIDKVIAIVERATGATALEKGVPEGGEQTLGEVRILVGKATERAKTISKFYKAAWYRIAKKWDGIMQANDFPMMSLYKLGRDGKMYEKKVTSADWKSKAGYEPSVASSSEQEADQLKNLQKFTYVKSQYPNNTALRKIAQKREMTMLDLTPQELREVEEEEERLIQEAKMMAMQQMAPEGQQQPQQGQAMMQQPQQMMEPQESPEESQLLEELASRLA